MRPTRLLLPLLLAATLPVACSHTESTAKIAENGGRYDHFKPAARTSIVGQAVTVDLQDAYAIIELRPDRQTFPQGTFLVARDQNNVPTAVLETTRHTTTRSTPPDQGVMIVSGSLQANYEIVEPGPELARLVDENIDKYLAQHPEEVAPAPAPVVPAPSASTSVPALPGDPAAATGPK